jgi:radical SAM protein with 4Fe4S-binding SPASM domain
LKTIQILTNLDCNLDCDYCYEHKHEGLVNNIEDIKEYLDFEFSKLSEEDKKDLAIEPIGGETLYHIELLEDIIKYINSIKDKYKIKSVIYSISTNGTLIGTSKRVQDFIKKYMNILTIGISIDGLKDIHDKHRVYVNTRKGTYDDALKGFNFLKEIKFPMCKVGLKATYTHETIPYLFQSIKYLLSLGVKNTIGSNPIFEEKWDLEKDSDMILNQVIKIIDYIFENNLVNESINLFHIIGKIDLRYYGYNFIHENRNWCGSCTHMICLGFDKEVYGCNRFCTSGNKNLKIGYLRDGKVDITNQDLIDEVSIQYTIYPEQCLNCDLHSQCGSCAALPYEVNPNDPKEYINKQNMCGWTYAISLGRYYFRDKLKKYMKEHPDFVYYYDKQNDSCSCENN